MKLPWLDPLMTEFGNRLKAERLAHAFLLSGPPGIGKFELSRRLLGALLCLDNQVPACGACRSCHLLESGTHPDCWILSLEPNEKTGKMRQEIIVEQVRRLIASIQLTTTVSPRKVALIHPAEAMNRNAANALLKTLEEPPGDAVLILLTHDAARLPATIRSRCQALQATLPEPDRALEWLLETGDVPEREARNALDAAAGSPLRALALLESGQAGQYAAVSGALDQIISGDLSPMQVMSELAEVDPEQLWSWLSLISAHSLRRNIHQKGAAKDLSELQSMADRNRYLLNTPVRRDLLLLDWLIQWSRLSH